MKILENPLKCCHGTCKIIFPGELKFNFAFVENEYSYEKKSFLNMFLILLKRPIGRSDFQVFSFS